MDDTILTWSASNWVTVLLMVFVGFMVMSVLGRVAIGAKAKMDAKS
jgi:hypothetical protein